MHVNNKMYLMLQTRIIFLKNLGDN